MISIITPVYNGEKFIESCIKTVIDQNCPTVEHIIVDGDSSDKTVNIIKYYADKYSHIRWISEKDNGQSDAMNKGIAMAKGEIMGILNVDDFYEPNLLNHILDLFKVQQVPSLLVGKCKVWNDKGQLAFVNQPKRLRLVDLLLGDEANHFPINPSAYFYHTCLHKKAGLYKVDEEYGMDLDFILRAVQVANTKYIDEFWGNFRMIEGTKTVTDSKNGQGALRKKNILKNYQQFLPLFQRVYVLVGYELYEIKRQLKAYLKGA
jgi:glycosyltransferase involved in cell wall biosynthesis